ncbi:geranylgeranyl diphosphate reductase [Methylobacterium currus]|uniref:geranylgeranyl diphosphate reductase n=1 Tax=Methylobacterium currus TaxID=2051553 RepID=A0A2R4WFB5_9HYPH|nr:geranylgeranyl diphosphate reductase [Methylobacterium currus]AWB20199.1 geranylgeranyl diphosphate reductase [Methylobacterium currus]UHC15050.1 geranylgeranyl diphosphate reductase [Methylobacterium currus]
MDEGIVDAVVVGGGPSGATAATDLARLGRRVVLLDRAGRIKPCGGAIPPRLIRDFAIPDELLVAKIRSARMVSPRDRAVDMPVGEGFVGMVDRGPFDEWLRVRAALAGAERVTGTYLRLTRADRGPVTVHYRDADGGETRIRARLVIGADGANSAVGRQEIPAHARMRQVFAYHEIVRTPPAGAGAIEATRCDVYYQGVLSPDFYAWIFPHGDTLSIGTGSARKGFSLRGAVGRLRAATGLDLGETVRREGAPLPLKPLSRFDNGRDVLLTGDAAGLVAPASGEGIYYAMFGGRLAAEAAHDFLATGNPRALGQARRRFLNAHGRVFWILRLMQGVWYRNDSLRERFVSICRDPDVQSLTWDAYMNKELVRAKPAAHARIFFKDLAHLFRWVSP